MRNQHQAAYFYLPASEGRSAEIILIVNSDRRFVQVPMREEDVVLEAFFQRDMTEMEINSFGTNQVWQIFGTWNDLADDHIRYRVSDYVLSELYYFKDLFPLSEGMAA
ncbi:hypothetical protein [Pontibacter sp. HJ8]